MFFKLIIALNAISISIIDAQELFATKNIHDIYNINTTQAFFAKITSDAFDKAFASEDNIEFIPSILNYPDLPVWMNYRHINGTNRAFLYGSPSLNDDADIEIEVIAINKYNYETTKDIMKFRITKREKIANFEVELKFVNYNIDDMFENNRLNDVLDIFKDKLWKESEVIYITKIASPLDVGGRLPLDPREKEGVIIRIGSTDNYTRDLLDLEREVERIKNRDPCPRKYKATSAEYMFRNKGFHSDWCSFQLIRLLNENQFQRTESKVETSVSMNSKESLDDDYMPLRVSFPKRDYVIDVMFCFAIPLIIGTMVVSTLTCIFFYNKEELVKESYETPVQLEQYNSIQRASSKLRSLSQNRNYAPPQSSNSTLPRAILKPISPTSTLPKAIVASMPTSRTGTMRNVPSGLSPLS